MGLLDDAIREHLELKRRRGADPSDVARQEDEALGAVTGLGGAVQAPDHEPPGEAAAPPAPVIAEHAGETHAPAYELAPEPEVHAEPEEASSSPRHGDPLADEAFGAHSAHQVTREFSAGELHEALGRRGAAAEPEPAAAEPSAEPEDELEETPDFLQETPEHDRLWFEQKPPKDFDF